MQGSIGLPFALLSIFIGSGVGLITSRIFNLSWSHDGKQVVGAIDKLGWIILGLYILFELIRATLFETVVQTGYDATATTFAFVSAAPISRVLGLRGRILRILKQEKIFG